MTVFILLFFQEGQGRSSSTRTFYSLTVRDGLSNGSIRTIVQDQYSFITAGNGEEALHKAIQHNPDLIISDIMMR
ncbi:MAG: hypothetical protein ACOC59_01115 [Bacteroidota bacterium]